MTHEERTKSADEAQPRREVDVDGSPVDIFALPADEETLEELLRDLFENHWREITFGPIIQGAAYEFKAPSPPTHVGMFDGYLTVAFGAPHFHLCIGAHKGALRHPTPPALARHRQTSRAELYRRLDRSGAPVSWGLRLFNGEGEQQITVLLPNPFLDQDSDKVLKTPQWERLALWDHLRARWLGQGEGDPLDRSGRGFSHD
ncbi:DUF7676 family protein [Methylocapsa palsarum]|uniref:Uncharacterized protein n=1 Tax=Methylocapsa palsarum TaxID=1612308 RepID=A0A1I3YRJ7_9HYPH|nr:hypothetical protein [Methylocapsa palsarum]SFK34452.1 hypothetical protein SAMN05444581_106132 [Methylocapsa palsarum]